MPSSDASFREYLNDEVHHAGKSYEQARGRLLALIEGTEKPSGPPLEDAAQNLAEALRMYTGALRRLAHYSAHQGRMAAQRPAVQDESVAAHA